MFGISSLWEPFFVWFSSPFFVQIIFISPCDCMNCPRVCATLTLCWLVLKIHFNRLFFLSRSPFCQMIETNESGVTKTSEDTYAEYANSFDLSLLPMDESEIDLIPEHQHQHQQSALSASVTQSSHNLMNSGGNSTFTVSSTPPLSPEYIPTRVYESTNVPFAIKTEHWPSHNIVPKVIVDESPPSIASFATHSPSEEQFLTIFPPSPTPSIDFNNIKKEQPYFGNAFGLYPPSPPDSNGAPSPVGYHFADIKTEPFDIGCNETSVNLTSFLPNTFDLATNTLTPSSSPYDSSVLLQQQQQQLATTTTTSTAAITSTIPTLSLTPPLDSTRKDHQLLREYLQDTSFQKKHNLKPLALESLFVGDWSARGDIEPVISLALEHARKDVQQTCVTLNISAGKYAMISHPAIPFHFLCVCVLFASSSSLRVRSSKHAIRVRSTLVRSWNQMDDRSINS